MTKRKVMLRAPKDVTPVSLINSLTCFFAALNQIGATSPNSFLPHCLLSLKLINFFWMKVSLTCSYPSERRRELFKIMRHFAI